MTAGPEPASEASPATLRVETVPLPDVDPGLLEAWRALGAEAVEPNVFFEPQLLLPAVRWLAEGHDVRLLTVWRGRRLVLAVPVSRTRNRRLPFPALTTWEHAYRYVGTPLLHPDALHDAPAAALLALQRSGPGLLVLEQVYVEGPVVGAFRRAAVQLGATWSEQDVWERPVVEAREEETYLETTLSSRSAKTLRRLRRNLERDVGEIEYRDVAGDGDPRETEAEVEGFLAMELGGWKGREGTAMANTESHAAFFREACRAFAEDGRLELWQLRAGGTPAARQCHLLSGDTVFHWKTAYDEDRARFSPGVQLELDLLHAFHVDPALRMLDSCTDDVPGTSARLYPDRRAIGTVLVGVTPRARLKVRAVTWLMRVRTRLAGSRTGVPATSGQVGDVPG